MTRRIIARLPSRRLAPTVRRVSADGLHVWQDGVDRLIVWSEIDRVMAALAGQVVGDQQILVIGTRSGAALTVTQAEPLWGTLVTRLHLHLSGAKRAAIWQLELAGGANQVEVYRR